MAEIIDDEFLISNYRAVQYSSYINDKENSQQIRLEISKKINDFIHSLPLDRRAIAISTDYHCHLWDFLSSTTTGFQESVFVGLNHFSQLVTSILRPTKALVSFPDHNLNLVEALHSLNCQIFLLNSPSLFNFENFALTHEGYTQDISYTVLDYQDLLTDAETVTDLDLIVSGSIDFTSEPYLLDKYIEMLSSGGVLYIGETSNFGKVSADLGLNRMSDLHDAISRNENIYHFYIPFGIGFDIIVKK